MIVAYYLAVDQALFGVRADLCRQLADARRHDHAVGLPHPTSTAGPRSRAEVRRAEETHLVNDLVNPHRTNMGDCGIRKLQQATRHNGHEVAAFKSDNGWGA